MKNCALFVIYWFGFLCEGEWICDKVQSLSVICHCGVVIVLQVREKQRKLFTTATTAIKTFQELFESNAISAPISIFAWSVSPSV